MTLCALIALPASSFGQELASPTPSASVDAPSAPALIAPSADSVVNPQTAPVLTEPAGELPGTPAAHIESMTLFPNQGEIGSGAGFTEQRFGYVLHGSVRASYESNIFIQARNEQEDFIFRISPAVAIGWGDFKGEVLGASRFGDLYDHYLGKSYIFADYRPSWSMFADHSDQNDVGQDLVVAGEWQLQKLSVSMQARYLLENTPDEDIGTRKNQTRISGALNSEYNYSGKTSFEVNGSVATRAYDRGGDDSQEWRNEDWLNYQIRPKVNISLGSTFGYIARETGSSENFQQALLRVRYRATESFTFGLSGGPQFRQTEGSSDDVNAVFSFSATWTPTVDTYLALQGVRRTVPSGTRGQSYTGTGATLQFRRLLFRHFFFGMLAGYRNSNYDGVPSGRDYGREDNLYYVQPSVGFILTEWMNCELGGEYRTNKSNREDRAFEATTISAQLNVLF